MNDIDWTEHCENHWEMLTGTLLDTRTPLERLYKSIKNLKEILESGIKKRRNL